MGHMMNKEAVAKELYDAFTEKHKEVFKKDYEPDHYRAPELKPLLPPTWEKCHEQIKECWRTTADVAIKILGESNV